MNTPNTVSPETPRTEGPTTPASTERRTYQAPRLRVLGSVREITLGIPSTGSDGTTQGPKSVG